MCGRQVSDIFIEGLSTLDLLLLLYSYTTMLPPFVLLGCIIAVARDD
jgi:hypothetical protein